MTFEESRQYDFIIEDDSFPSSETNAWIEEYQQTCLATQDADTICMYRRILQHFTQWIGKQKRNTSPFDPEHITQPLVERYLKELATKEYSPIHCQRVKSVQRTGGQLLQWPYYKRIVKIQVPEIAIHAMVVIK